MNRIITIIESGHAAKISSGSATPIQLDASAATARAATASPTMTFLLKHAVQLLLVHDDSTTEAHIMS